MCAFKPRTAPEPPPVANARWIPLTKGQFVLVDEEDYEELSKYNWHSDSNNYAVRESRINKTRLRFIMHRQIMNFPSKKFEIDHINMNQLDNRKTNLRLATHQQNNVNKGNRIDNKTGYKGIYWEKSRNKWQAHIEVNQKKIHLGRFAIKEDAARAYDTAAKKHFGEFARLNFPEAL